MDSTHELKLHMPLPWKVVTIPPTHTMAEVRSADHLVVFAGHLEDAMAIAATSKVYESLHEAVVEYCHECADKTLANCKGKCFVAKWREALMAANGGKDIE